MLIAHFANSVVLSIGLLLHPSNPIQNQNDKRFALVLNNETT